MTEGYLLGVDLGTTGLKAALFDTEGKLHATAASEYQTSYPGPGLAEQNPSDWWTSFKQTVNSILSKSGIRGDRILGIGISSQSSTVLPLGKDGLPLTTAIIWMDSRAGRQQSSMKTKFAALLERTNPNSIESFYSVPKML